MRGMHFMALVGMSAVCLFTAPLDARQQLGKDVFTDQNQTPTQAAANEKRCRLERASNESVRVMVERTHTMDTLIVAVTPAEAAAMRKEERDAAGDERRLAALQRRPLYAAMRAHEALRNFSDDLDELQTIPDATPKTHIMAASGLILPSLVVESSWSEFAASPPAKTLPPAAVQTWNLNAGMTGMVEEYIWCWAAAIKN